jgi:hypothetical protein
MRGEYSMNKLNKRAVNTPIEKHETASWANIEDLESTTNVTIPSETQVINAKEYVDSNEK